MYERDGVRDGALRDALERKKVDEERERVRGMIDAAGLQPQKAVSSKPNEPAQPLLSEMYDRLQRVSNNLADAICRVEAVTDRVLGPVPIHPDSTTGGTSPSKPPAAEVLTGLICGIALQVERLHDVASRIERIG